MRYEDWVRLEEQSRARPTPASSPVPGRWVVTGLFGDEALCADINLQLVASTGDEALAFANVWIREWYPTFVEEGCRWVDGPHIHSV